MGEGESCVETRGVGMAAKLIEGYEVELAEVKVDVPGDDLLG